MAIPKCAWNHNTVCAPDPAAPCRYYTTSVWPWGNAVEGANLPMAGRFLPANREHTTTVDAVSAHCSALGSRCARSPSLSRCVNGPLALAGLGSGRSRTETVSVKTPLVRNSEANCEHSCRHTLTEYTYSLTSYFTHSSSREFEPTKKFPWELPARPNEQYSPKELTAGRRRRRRYPLD